MKRLILTVLVVIPVLLSAFYASDDTNKSIAKESESEVVVSSLNEKVDKKEKLTIILSSEERDQLITERVGYDKRTIGVFNLIDSYKEDLKGNISIEMQKRLDEIDEEMMKNMTGGYRFRAIAEAYGMDRPRITLDEVISFIEELQSTGLIEDEIVKIHGPCDAFVGSGVGRCHNWLNDTGSERVVVSPFYGLITYYNENIVEVLFDPYDI